VIDISLATSVAAGRHVYEFTPGDVFLLFFIMLGPLKLIGPYFHATHAIDAKAARAIAFKVFALAIASVLLGALLGSSLIAKWHLSPPVLMLAAGLIFLLVALQLVLQQYEAPPAQHAQAAPPNLLHLVFPVTVTPYGIAAAIALTSLSRDAERTGVVLGLLGAVMVLNLLAMLLVRTLMRGIVPIALQILGAVLGVLQVALALNIIISALVRMGIPMTPG